MRFRTLRGRLTALAVLAATVAVAMLTLVFNLVLEQSLESDANGLLQSRAAAAGTTLTTAGGALRVRESPDDAAVDSQIWIYDGRRAIERARAGRRVQAAADGLAARPGGFRDVGDSVRLHAAPITRGAERIGTVVAGLSLAPYERTTDIALIASIALGALLLAAVLATSRLAIGRALTPVTEMTHQAADWTEHDLERRFGTDGRPDELGELAATFDDLLNRLAASVRHEQRLSAELSHELRTPLARILAEAELLQRRERSPEERRAAYETVRHSAEQMTGILETLMTAARADARVDRGRSDVNETLRRLAAHAAPELAGDGIELDLPDGGSPLTAGVDAEVVERIVNPLLDNAGRYAQHRITIRSGQESDHVVIAVGDDGPGVPPDAASSIFEPGVRANGSDGHAGAGLGLPLARRLARAAGGDIRLATPEEGKGAELLVELPG